MHFCNGYTGGIDRGTRLRKENNESQSGRGYQDEAEATLKESIEGRGEASSPENKKTEARDTGRARAGCFKRRGPRDVSYD